MNPNQTSSPSCFNSLFRAPKPANSSKVNMAYKDKMKKRFGFIPGSKKRKSKHVEDPTDTIVSKTSHAIPRGSPKPPGSVSSSEISALEKQKAVAGSEIRGQRPPLSYDIPLR